MLHVGGQVGLPVIQLWAASDEKVAIYEDRRFFALGTGTHLDLGQRSWPAPDITYIGTALVGGYVWHVFELFELTNDA